MNKQIETAKTGDLVSIETELYGKEIGVVTKYVEDGEKSFLTLFTLEGNKVALYPKFDKHYNFKVLAKA